MIATVLLIAFAVALGAMVMSWGRDWFNVTTQEVSIKSATAQSCSLDVSIAVLELSGKTSLCNNPGTSIQFVIDNRGADIQGLKATIIDDTGQVFNNINPIITSPPLKQANAGKYTVPYSGLGTPEKVIITPQIQVQGAREPVFCTQAQLEIDEIPDC